MLADAVDKSMVRVHRAERPTQLIDRVDLEGRPLWDSLLAAVEARIVLITGPDPTGPLLDLAAQAIAYEIASQFEYAVFPEQQGAGNFGRGWFLHQKFLEMFEDLKRHATSGSGGATQSGLPKAAFPATRAPYPDPFRSYTGIVPNGA